MDSSDEIERRMIAIKRDTMHKCKICGKDHHESHHGKPDIVRRTNSWLGNPKMKEFSQNVLDECEIRGVEIEDLQGLFNRYLGFIGTTYCADIEDGKIVRSAIDQLNDAGYPAFLKHDDLLLIYPHQEG